MKIKDFTTRPIWAEDSWLAKHAGETLGLEPNKEGEEAGEGEEGAGGKVMPAAGKVFDLSFCLVFEQTEIFFGNF